MRKLVWQTLIVAGCGVTMGAVALHSEGAAVAAEDPDTAAVTKKIQAEKILGASNQFNVVLYPDTHEAIISTYADSASKDLQKDCKIDAVLLARAIINTATQTVRVKARFYHPNRIWYREVVVTKPDIIAFSKGAVSKDDLLNSLEVKKYDTSQGGDVRREATSYRYAAGTVSANANLNQFSDKGLMFYYPKAWGSKPMSNQWGDFAELTFNRKSWCSIIVRLTDKETPAQVADDDDKYYWQSHQRHILGRKNIAFGASNHLQGLMIYIKDDSNPSDPKRYEKHLYFGYPHRIYSFSIRFCEEDYAAVNEDLNTILGTMAQQ